MRSQRQDSLDDQMRTVLRLARDAGCWDAYDWITRSYLHPRAALADGIIGINEMREMLP